MRSGCVCITGSSRSCRNLRRGSLQIQDGGNTHLKRNVRQIGTNKKTSQKTIIRTVLRAFTAMEGMHSDCEPKVRIGQRRTDLKGHITYNGLNTRISWTDSHKYQVKYMCGVQARMFISMKCELALVSASLGDTPRSSGMTALVDNGGMLVAGSGGCSNFFGRDWISCQSMMIAEASRVRPRSIRRLNYSHISFVSTARTAARNGSESKGSGKAAIDQSG